MSQYKGNGEKCRHCGTTYGKFRTGFTYQDIWSMLEDFSEDSADWKYKRRGTVLGHWFQIKQQMWQKHLADCRKQERFEKRRRQQTQRNAHKGSGVSRRKRHVVHG